MCRNGFCQINQVIEMDTFDQINDSTPHPYLILLLQLGADVLDVAPADGAEEDDEEDPVEVHAEDRADVIVAVVKQRTVSRQLLRRSESKNP
jgi:hypothetical protein